MLYVSSAETVLCSCFEPILPSTVAGDDEGDDRSHPLRSPSWREDRRGCRAQWLSGDGDGKLIREEGWSRQQARQYRRRRECRTSRPRGTPQRLSRSIASMCRSPGPKMPNRNATLTIALHRGGIHVHRRTHRQGRCRAVAGDAGVVGSFHVGRDSRNGGAGPKLMAAANRCLNMTLAAPLPPPKRAYIGEETSIYTKAHDIVDDKGAAVVTDEGRNSTSLQRGMRRSRRSRWAHSR